MIRSTSYPQSYQRAWAALAKTDRLAQVTGDASDREQMAKLKTSAAEMVAKARARIEEIETKDAIAMVDDPNVVIVDLRDVRERQRSGFIPGSFHCPRGMVEFWVDPDSPYYKDVFGQEKTYVFHCASGWRSALSVATLNDMGFKAAHLKEGFSTWADKGGPVEMPD